MALAVLKSYKKKVILILIGIIGIISIIAQYHVKVKLFAAYSSAHSPLKNSPKQILDFLFQQNIFLIDVDKLKEIEIYQKSENLEIYFQKYFHHNSVLSFGCFYEDAAGLLNKVNYIH